MGFQDSSLVMLQTSFLPIQKCGKDTQFVFQRNPRKVSSYIVKATISSLQDKNNDYGTKLVTFLGKGGSGKTTSAVLAAQMLLEPLRRLKEADARLNMTQGVLEGVVSEELGVLPGMDSIFSASALESFVGFLGDVPQKSNQKDVFDIIIYDGLNTEETIRMIGAASKTRLYLKYLRDLAEKTDLGRLAGPSLLRLVEESVSISSRRPRFTGKMSSEVWDDLGQTLERVSSVFADPHRFASYLVMDPNNPASLNSALRYWGCAIQAGAQVSGALSSVSPSYCVESVESIKKTFSPLPFAYAPNLSVNVPLDWNEIIHGHLSEDLRSLLTASGSSCVTPSIKFDPTNKTVTLLMPGFDKSEIKLYQFRGGSELLVEAGDQRRVIRLPSQIQGKVGGAKFIDRNIIITIR
ncbi:uncharacterized protein At1g26090, chloroplastic isoform X2 [Daucus carota subsp. sativus]|uniref:uncharacterized protein At1g26090, chloroplastic isoform X2 n=1 Tax=Daucus carota subsp. sativus TaxID=79200 RepID=UPI003083768B